ncbi:MAG: 16S rRNA (guanine(966)-N(2))-methyltransferase RsmD [Deltaproteobacteria bacterium]|nr:16S rRNA (guanine(966)-N(2))-methyltransferase RsmD [Deltaproteobacteria bacterium]
MRIVGGSAGGRKLLTPRGLDTRPTSDKVKEALFSILAGMMGPLDGCAVLDVFAGTGNLGIEALSRGAGRALFIDSGREAAAIIAKNLELSGFGDRAGVIARDFRSALTAMEAKGELFELIFIDPPYQKGLLEKCLAQLGESPIIDDGAVIVAEHSSREEIASEYGMLQRCDSRVYGDTALAFFIKHKKGSS